jgi:alkanesulfonate monooxygenase SsuD/methylene tetrahydromethanopterin reductase-like flavin-dependent oxidoreductase (luciferase family)
VKLGIGLPTALGKDLTRGFFLDWCRAADQAGFHVVGIVDQPDYDSWDPLASLAIAAGATERIRLMTSVLLLPARNEVLVAKQAAVIDRVSGGRLDLGVGLGARESDYKVLGARFAKRGKKLERQLRKIRRVWRAAKKSTDEEGVLGPAPLQKPLPPIWLGGKTEPAFARAAAFGDSFIFGSAIDPATAAETGARIRAMVPEKKQKKFLIGKFAWYAVGDDPAVALEHGTRALTRYYHGAPPADPEHLIVYGGADAIAQAAKEFDQAGVDVLLLCPVIGDLRQLEVLAEDVLPAYRVPAR